MLLSGLMMAAVALATLYGVVWAARREYQDDDARAAVVSAYVKPALPVGPMYVAFFLFFDAPWAALAPGVFFLTTLAAWVLLRLRKRRLAAIVMVYGIWIGPVWCAMATGGIYSALIVWMAPAPFMGGPLIGRSASAILGASAVISALVMGISPELPPGVVEMASDPGHTLLAVACAMTAIALLSFYGYATTKTYYQHSLKLEEQNEEIVTAAAQIERTGAEMRLVLDGVGEGLVMVDGTGRLMGQWSAQLSRWFTRPEAGMTIWSLVEPYDPVNAEMIEIGFDDLEMGLMPAEVTLAQLPKQICLGEQTLSLHVEPHDDSFLVVFRDISADIARKQLEANQRQILSLVQHYQKDSTGTRSFVAESTDIIDRLAGARGKELARELHTAKGNAGIYGLHTLAGLCHEAEDQLEAEGAVSRATVEAVRGHWTKLVGEFHALVGNDTKGFVKLSAEEVARLQGAVEQGASRDRIAALISELQWAPVSAPLRRLGEQAERLAERLGKQISVGYEGDSTRLDPDRFAPFFSALVHAVRNAVDHGLEAPPVREELGKSAAGTLNLSVRRRGDSAVSVDVVDDGAGVNWAKVREKAEAMGLSVATDLDLQRALFADGLSTADEVTAVSGRGVGSSALLEIVEAMGGKLELRSVPEVGTTLRCTMPLRQGVALPPQLSSVA